MSELPNKKRRIHNTKFQEGWLKNAEYKGWLVEADEHTGMCKHCGAKFTVKYDGEKAVKKHLNSEYHKKAMQSVTSNKLLTAFMPVRGKKLFVMYVCDIFSINVLFTAKKFFSTVLYRSRRIRKNKRHFFFLIFISRKLKKIQNF